MNLRLSLLFLLLSFGIQANAQRGAEPYAADWRVIDSLLNTALPQSAGKRVQEIYDKANAAGDPVQMLKAQVYLIYAQDGRVQQDSPQVFIRIAEKEAALQPFPISNIWHSLAAEAYWQYYQQHRWQIMQPTPLATADSNATMQEWDARRFMNVIAGHYRASLQRPQQLIRTGLAPYEPIIIKGENTRHLRPTLYDLLAFAALSYFETDEYGITQPAERFEIDEAAYFSSPDVFSGITRLPLRDTTSLQYLTLRTYQQLLALHLEDRNPDALLDANLHRLEYVYRHAVMADKRELYERALRAMADAYPGKAATGEALYRIQQLRYDEAMAYTTEEVAEKKKSRRLPDIKRALDEIVERYPNSEGGANAANLRNTILSQELSLQAEEVVLPGEYSKVLLTYKNLDAMSFRIVRLSEELFRKVNGNYPDSTAKARLLKTEALQQWRIGLPGTADLDVHKTEVKIDPLPIGMYAVLVSGKDDFSSENNSAGVVVFQVSRLGMVLLSGATGKIDGVVMDRKTGEPVGGARLGFERRVYNSKTKKYESKETAGTTAASGTFGLPGNESYSYMQIRKDEDRVLLGNVFSHRDRQSVSEEDEDDTVGYYFTDRAIYRPGQTVFFKGIQVYESTRSKVSRTIGGYRTVVRLRDANGLALDSLNVITNEFGSYTGSFIIPTGSLTGRWSIRDDEWEEASFTVEEYKRPKFEVVFDTLAGTYELNKEIEITGMANSFAGAAIDGAAVSYRISRRVHYPYRHAYTTVRYPSSHTQEIKSGTVTTDKVGRFEVVFTALPDNSIDSSLAPIFTYVISVDVTDMNGETRNGEQSVQIGYQSLKLESNASMDRINLLVVDSFRVFTTNLNDNFIPADVSVTVEALKSPAQPFRMRLWNKPDQFVMDSVTFKTRFPQDEYRDEGDKTKWARRQTYTVTKSSRPDMHFGLERTAFPNNGWYRITFKAVDGNGAWTQRENYTLMADNALKGSSYEPLSFVIDEVPYKKGEVIKATLSSSFKHAHIYRVLKSGSVTTLDQVSVTEGQPVPWIISLSPSSEKIQNLLYWMVKDNRVYSEEETIKLPISQKGLVISWETHRSKLQPGQKESWTMTIAEQGKSAVMAELAATLYDASLDEFTKHQWGFDQPFESDIRAVSLQGKWDISNNGVSIANIIQPEIHFYNKTYDEMFASISPKELLIAKKNRTEVSQNAAGVVWYSVTDYSGDRLGLVEGEATPITVRKNLHETAFFFPQLRTDAEGNVKLEFTMPEALTQWRLLAIAHTRDMATGTLEGTIRTQKDLMVIPGLPRFFRQGDEITLTAKINNLSAQDQNGTANIEILDAATMRPLNTMFNLRDGAASFTALAGRSTSVSWKLRVPLARYEPVVVRITARAGNFTDGEENTLPVLTNRMLVTESLPLWSNTAGTRAYKLRSMTSMAEDLSKGGDKDTKAPHALTVEYTTNPAWLAVQALPYLADYPYECAEQTFNRYYANALAAHIVQQTPKLKEIFRQWEKEDTAALLSKLEQNAELKSALLEETPWVLEAKSESEQRRNVALLFQGARMASARSSALRKLRDLQNDDGSFPWFKGGSGDRYITQYIATGIARLKKMGIEDETAEGVLELAKAYSSIQLIEDYRRVHDGKAKPEEKHIGAIHVQYLYLQSLYDNMLDSATQKAVAYYRRQAGSFWPSFNPYMKGMASIALKHNDAKTAGHILQSLRETAVRDEEQGLYWVRPGSSWHWQDAPIETQALLIEAFAAVGEDSMVNPARHWLLRNKQAQHWSTTKATADACYALLLQGSDWLGAQPAVNITLGDTTIRSAALKSQAGTGYFKVTIPRDKIRPEMGNITLSSEGAASNAGNWGAVYYQYFQDIDKVQASFDSSRPRTPLAIKKQLFIERNSNRGPVLEEITATNPMKVGDKVKVRIVLSADRDMDYVHLKDGRASCFEPVNVLSGYRWQAGLGYYESTRDASSNFFISWLQRGTYVFEYGVTVTAAGEFGAGIATAQCMYAPEFSAHSAGVRVVVR